MRRRHGRQNVLDRNMKWSLATLLLDANMPPHVELEPLHLLTLWQDTGTTVMNSQGFGIESARSVDAWGPRGSREVGPDEILPCPCVADRQLTDDGLARGVTQNNDLLQQTAVHFSAFFGVRVV